MKYSVLTFALLVSLPVARTVWGGESMLAIGVAPITGSRATAEMRAQREGLARALASVLQNWLSVREIENQADLLNRWFFAQPQMYVSEITGASVSVAGGRLTWSGFATFDSVRVASRLRAIGLLSPWDRDPTFVIVPVSGPASALLPLTTTGWFTALERAGFRLSLADVPPQSSGDPATVTEPVVDGVWKAEIRTRTLPHPLLTSVTWTVTDAVIHGDVAGEPIQFDFVIAPPDLVPPPEVVEIRAIDEVVSRWAPRQFAAMAESMWTLGDLEFANTAAWVEFDRRIELQRAIFHQAHPTWVRRRGEGLIVRYGFYLNPGEEDEAESWIVEQGFRVRREEPRRFVAEQP